MKSRQIFFENLVAQNALGGIPKDYEFANKTLYQIFEDLFSGTSFTEVKLEPNTGLEFNPLSELRTKYNTLKDDAAVSQIINKLNSKQASYWKTKTIVEVLDEILFPASLPTYTPTTISLSHTLTLPYYEIKTSQSNSLTLSTTKNDAGDYSSLFIKRDGSTIITDNTLTSTPGPPYSAGSDYPNPNLPNKNYSLAYTDNIIVDPGTTTWTGYGNYSSGLPKKNSEGVDDTRAPAKRTANAPQLFENNFESNSVSITGIYPYYYGYISGTKPSPQDIADLIANYTADTPSIRRVLKPLSNTEEVYFNATAPVWMWIAHTGTAKTNYITGNQPTPTNITSGSLFDSNQITSFSNNYWTNVSFNLYIASRVSSTAGNYWFKFR